MPTSKRTFFCLPLPSQEHLNHDISIHEHVFSNVRSLLMLQFKILSLVNVTILANSLNSRQHIKEKSRKAGQSIQLQSVIASPSISFNSAERSIQVYNGPPMEDSASNFHSKVSTPFYYFLAPLWLSDRAELT